MIRVITFGTFDLLHVGHLRILERAAALGDQLIVGVSSDELSISKKKRKPVYSLDQRMEIIRALRCVDKVFTEHSLEEKKAYVLEHQAQILVMGNDWEGKFDWLSDVCEVRYLDRTPSISTTSYIEVIQNTGG